MIEVIWEIRGQSSGVGLSRLRRSLHCRYGFRIAFFCWQRVQVLLGGKSIDALAECPYPRSLASVLENR